MEIDRASSAEKWHCQIASDGTTLAFSLGLAVNELAVRVQLTLDEAHALARQIVSVLESVRKPAPWPGIKIAEPRPCVVVVVDGPDRFEVSQYAHGARRSAYFPCSSRDLNERVLALALADCRAALAVSGPGSDPA